MEIYDVVIVPLILAVVQMFKGLGLPKKIKEFHSYEERTYKCVQFSFINKRPG